MKIHFIPEDRSTFQSENHIQTSMTLTAMIFVIYPICTYSVTLIQHYSDLAEFRLNNFFIEVYMIFINKYQNA